MLSLSDLCVCLLFQVKSLIADIHASLSAAHVDGTLLSRQTQQLLEFCQEGEKTP
jgi:hypothetical protein